MPLAEINFDGIVGPSHNYAGLSFGNVASMSHAGAASQPRAAALEGIAKMRAKPESKSATFTTFLPDDDAYLPCVSLLDFKLRKGGLLLTAACRSLDAGRKMPGNLVELARLQGEVAGALGSAPGALTVWIASAHVYERDRPGVERALAGAEPEASDD